MEIRKENTPIGKIFCHEHSARELISLLSCPSIEPETFYLTGFETIFFEAGRDFILRSVLSSTMSFDRELLIIKITEDDDRYIHLCEKLDINHKVIQANQDGVDMVVIEQWLATSIRNTHILVSGELLKLGEHIIHKLGELSRRYRRSLVIDCGSNPMMVKQMFQFQVDFMIANSNDNNNKSMVLARRSKLVQTEGNARTATYDLYSHWKSSVSSRTAEIEPMSA